MKREICKKYSDVWNVRSSSWTEVYKGRSACVMRDVNFMALKRRLESGYKRLTNKFCFIYTEDNMTNVSMKNNVIYELKKRIFWIKIFSSPLTVSWRVASDFPVDKTGINRVYFTVNSNYEEEIVKRTPKLQTIVMDDHSLRTRAPNRKTIRSYIRIFRIFSYFEKDFWCYLSFLPGNIHVKNDVSSEHGCKKVK